MKIQKNAHRGRMAVLRRRWAAGGLLALLFVLCVFPIRLWMEGFSTLEIEYRVSAPTSLTAEVRSTDGAALSTQRALVGDGAWHCASFPCPLKDFSGFWLRFESAQAVEIRAVTLRTAGLRRAVYTGADFPYTILDAAEAETGADSWTLRPARAGATWRFSAPAQTAGRIKTAALACALAFAAAAALTYALLPRLQRLTERAGGPVTALAAVFLTALLLSLAQPFAGAGKLFFPTHEEDDFENRTLAERPVFDAAQPEAFPAQYETYLNDHIPFKQQLVGLYSSILYHCFHQSTDDAVLLGQDGWLFYDSAKKGDGDTLRDYAGEEPYSDAETTAAIDTVRALWETCKARGIPFAFLAPPNKSNIYGEYLPEGYTRAARQRMDALAAQFTRSGLPFLYPKSLLVEHKGVEPLYYKLDSHWNERGAYFAYRELYALLYGETLPPLVELSTAQETIGKGDLSKMAQISGMRDTLYTVGYRPEVSGEAVKESLGRDPFDFILRQEGAAERTVLLLRDSYAIALIPFLQKDHATLVSLRYSPALDIAALIDQYQPDAVILELVERNMPTLMNS